MKISRLCMLAAAALVAGCGGGSAGGGVTPSTLHTPAPTQSPGANTNAQFSIVIPAASLNTQSARRPQYISAATRSLTLSVHGGAKLGTFDVSQGSSLCKSASDGSRTCTAAVAAPVGNDSFDVSTYDQTNGTGNVLASGTIVQTIGASSSPTIGVDLTGVTASIKVTLVGSMQTTGKPASVPVVVQALDASGNTIVGTYDRTITLTDNDPSGHTSLSATSVAASGASITLNYDGGHMTSNASVSATAQGIAAAPAQTFQTAPGVLSQYTLAPLELPDNSAALPPGAEGIVQGPDGNFWIAAATAGAIIKMTPDGRTTSYFPPTLYSFPEQLVVGKDGAVWFEERDGNNIGRIAMDGTITEYPIPTQSAEPYGICVGPDGNIWFTEQMGHAIGKVAADGSITEFPMGDGSDPIDLTVGPDRNLWITTSPYNAPSAVVVMSTSGSIVATHPLAKQGLAPYGIILGPDGNLWFGEYYGDVLARMTPSGQVTEYTTPTSKPGIISLAVAKDGDIWFAESARSYAPSGQVGYITPGSSTIHEVILNLPIHVHNVIVAQNGGVWYSGFGVFDGSPQGGNSYAGEIMP